MTASDTLDDLWVIWRDPDVRRYPFDDKPVDRETAVGVLESALRVAPRGLGLWVVERREHPSPIGCVAGSSPAPWQNFSGSTAQDLPR